MKIYKHEIKDGVAKAVEKSNSIAFQCDILQPLNVNEDNILSSFACLYNDESEKQQDLYYLNAILVSAGWNKNDDVFGVNELWTARNTPVNKQFNYMHDDTDIIGHITGSMVVDHNGKAVESMLLETDSQPEKIDIITSAVIYKTWSDARMRERIEELTKEIDEGKWSVSMECIFSNFDYAVIGPNNEQRVLSRTDESSFLTKHLRAYGGTGVYNGYKIGRLLRGFYFSGKGLVAKPANPRSIILNKEVNPFNSKADITFYNFLTAMENHNMSDITMQIEDLKAQLESSKANFDAEKSTIEKQNADKLAETVSANESILAEKDQLITSLEAKVKELEDSVAGMKMDKEKMMKEAEMFKKDMDKKQEELMGMKEQYATMMKEMKGMKRMASLIEAGASEEKANKIVEDFSDASDEIFASVVAILADKTPKPETKPEPEVKPEPAPVDFGSEGAEDDDDEEADASALDNAEGIAEATLANPESNQECQNLAIASAASWLRQSVLKSTKNLKK
jgi:hypothetical protein